MPVKADDSENKAEKPVSDSGDKPAAGWVPSASEPIVAADGHVVLSQEDIDARG